MAYLVNTSFNLLFPGQFEYPEEEAKQFRQNMEVLGKEYGLFEGIHMQSGFRIDPALFPRHPKMQFKTKKLRDFINTQLGWLVSRRAKELVEKFEPGVHQFIQVDLQQKNRTAWPEPYWMFNMCTRLDTAIAEEHSNCTRISPDKPYWTFAFGYGPETLAVRRAMVEHRSFWTDHRYARLFISDRFFKALTVVGIEEIGSNSLAKPVLEV